MPEAALTTTWSRPPIPQPGQEADAASQVDAVAAAMVDALAVAWTMFRVYHDPRPQDAFRRSVAALGTAPAYPWIVEVHGGGFRHAGRPVPTRRQAVPALARAAFARGIAALGFSGPPTPDDLVRLFEVLAFQEGGEGAGDDGPAEVLAAAGAARLIVIEHGRLVDAPDGLQEAEALVAADESAAAESARSDVSRRYLDEYRLLYERLQASDFQGLQELVHEFTDSFFALPLEQQTGLFEKFLARKEEEPFRLLLDQFSLGDLAELEKVLSPGTHPLLVEYARIAAEQEGGSQAPGDLLGAEQLVADRIARMLHSGRTELRRQVGEALRAQLPTPGTNDRAGVGAAAAVLALADEAAFSRITRSLAAKAAAAIGAGDLELAAWWSGALLAAARTRSLKETVRREMEAALHHEILDTLVLTLSGRDQPPGAIINLVALFALDPVIERLATAEDMGSRRALVGLLTAVARLRPGPLVRRLNDPRWYLVRNLVSILAQSGRPEAAAGLRTACSHRDHRVRREALRALPLLDSSEAVAAAAEALRDPETSLRMQALGLLKTTPGPEPDAALAAFLASGPPLEERLAAIGALGERGTAAARATLGRLARRRLWASAATRQARGAARRALEGKQP